MVLAVNTRNTIIQNNLIGVSITGTTPLPNTVGIDIQGRADQTHIISNVISSNKTIGIALGNNVTNSIIQGNCIGTDIKKSIMLGNGLTGITIANDPTAAQSNNLIGGTEAGQANTIAFNGTNAGATTSAGYGVLISGNTSIKNPIVNNAIYNNANNGIQLSDGGNGIQAPASLQTAIANLATKKLSIGGTAPTTPTGAHFDISFFGNDENRDQITEGKIFLGILNGIAAGASFIFTAPLSNVTKSTQWISTTATNLDGDGGAPGNTSPFSRNVPLSTQKSVTALKFSRKTPYSIAHDSIHVDKNQLDCTTLTHLVSHLTSTIMPSFLKRIPKKKNKLKQKAPTRKEKRESYPGKTRSYSVTVTDNCAYKATSNIVILNLVT